MLSEWVRLSGFSWKEEIGCLLNTNDLNSPFVSGAQWQVDFLHEGNVCQTLKLGSGRPLRAVYSSRKPWNCKWIPVWPCCVQLSASWRAVLWGRAQLFASPLPSIYPLCRLFCTEIKADESRFTCCNKILSVKRSEGAGEIKITGIYWYRRTCESDTDWRERESFTKSLSDKWQDVKIKTRDDTDRRNNKIRAWTQEIWNDKKWNQIKGNYDFKVAVELQ